MKRNINHNFFRALRRFVLNEVPESLLRIRARRLFGVKNMHCMFTATYLKLLSLAL